jgi:hypothetical protein
MNCYQHNDNPAIGICKSCQKAVCTVCAIDTGRGIACSESCAEEVKALGELVERNMRRQVRTSMTFSGLET